ncbi:MAG: tetratricopeptide repeat protein [Acidobacteria bacterium]|nr:tetratricopeptide repeat protein [Acidobacteriota bacterium]
MEREIITPLRVHGVDTWYSTDDIQTASEWERQIHKGLTACDWFLVALSPRAVESEWVRREVHWAVMRRKDKVVPVMLETCEPEDLHLGLLPIQYIDFRGGGGRALERLLAVWGLDKGTQVRRLYQAAQEAMAKEDWTSAAETLEAVLQLDPTHSQSLTDLDHVRRQEYVASLYEEGSRAVREKRWSDALFKLGRLREASADYKDVEGLIAFARAELDKAEAEQLYRRATEAAERVDWASAVELFQAVLNITPLHAGAQAGLSVSIRQKELAELYEAGREHLEGKRWGEALKMFRRARAIDRGYKDTGELIADVDALLAEEEEQHGKKGAQEREGREEAGGQSQPVQDQAPAEGQHGMRTASLTLKEKLFRDLKLLAATVALFFLVVVSIFITRGIRASYHDSKGDTLNGQKKYAEAEAEYRKAVEIEPDTTKHHDNLGLVLLRQGKYGDAEIEYRKAVELDPINADYHNKLGVTLLQQDKHAEAEAEHRKAIGLDPSVAMYHDNLGLVLLRQGKYGDAEVEQRKAVSLDSNNADYHIHLGFVLNEQEKYGEAGGEYLKAIELDPKNAKRHDSFGVALIRQGNYESAEVEYREAVELDPSNADYHNKLGLALIHQGKYGDAEGEYRKAIALDSNNSGYHVDLAGSLHYQGKHEEEREELLKALLIDPNNKTAKQFLTRR